MQEIDEIQCATRCNCENVVCDGCQAVCNLCSTVLCDACSQGCSKCDDEFCSACENFLVKCEYCEKEYCLICCAKKTTCVGCMKKPSRRRLVDATNQLKRVQQGMVAVGVVGQASGSPPAAAASSQAEVEAKEQAKAKLAAEEQAVAEKIAAQKSAAERAAAAAAKQEEAYRAAAAAAESDLAVGDAPTNSAAPDRERGTNMMSKKKKKKKKKGSGANVVATVPTSAPVAPPAAPAQAPAPAPAPEPSYPDQSLIYLTQHGLDDDCMDHKVIKKWVENVASRKTKATASQIHRYFKGRVDPDVIDSYLEAFNNNYRDTVIQCAEFLNIFVQPEKVEEEEVVASAEPVEDVNDDLVGGAFAAKERNRIGDFDFAEHPLERRANEAYSNDCKDLKLLQAILDEARGQPGLAPTRKMVSKMVKRIKASQEELKKIRQDHKRQDSKKEIPQALHPAYAGNKPAFTSFQPPTIAADKEPDAMVDIPPNVVGWVIGKAGVRINEIQQRTNAAMWMDQNFPAGEMRKLHIHGNKTQVDAAIKEVEFLMNSAPVNNARPGKGSEYQVVPPGHPDIVPPPSAKGHANRMIECPHALVGYLIGKKGAMIKRIKSHSNANVEVYQQFPDGVPRKVFISGPPEAVYLAVFMVEEVIASGKAADSPMLEASTTASSTASVDGSAPGTGPVLGFSTSVSQYPEQYNDPQGSPSPVDTLTHDFGDLGGLGNGAAGSYSSANRASASCAQMYQLNHLIHQPVDTQSAIDRLHQGLASAASPTVAPPPVAPPTSRGVGGGGGGVHQEYLAQQEALRNQWQHQQLWMHQQHQQHQQQLQLHQHQQLMQQPAPFFPTLTPSNIAKNGSSNSGGKNTFPPPPPGLPPAGANNSALQPPVGRNSRHSSSGVSLDGAGAAGKAGDDGGSGSGGGQSATSPPPFASVEELLVSVGYLSLLPNFLEQEFDVRAIALMTDKDFEEISVPKGPQLKIQRACREAGLESQDKTAHAPAAFSGSGSGSAAGFPTNSAVEDDSSDCNICFERKIEVTFVTCGHQICCETCGREQEGRPCPICRNVIQSAVKFYN